MAHEIIVDEVFHLKKKSVLVVAGINKSLI